MDVDGLDHDAAAVGFADFDWHAVRRIESFASGGSDLENAVDVLEAVFADGPPRLAQGGDAFVQRRLVDGYVFSLQKNGNQQRQKK